MLFLTFWQPKWCHWCIRLRSAFHWLLWRFIGRSGSGIYSHRGASILETIGGFEMIFPWAWGGVVISLISGCRSGVHFLDWGSQVADVLVNVLVDSLPQLTGVVLECLGARLHGHRRVVSLIRACCSRACCRVVDLGGYGRGDGHLVWVNAALRRWHSFVFNDCCRRRCYGSRQGGQLLHLFSLRNSMLLLEAAHQSCLRVLFCLREEHLA